ncbi:phenoloxidase 8-like [Uranotaenia lowii]|uniref:phenoloxidase 8-like n=1 Tax=Uranotaenia lowii TaxID=190385 RepID=UPI00247A87AF|nr:phenoloxidase 8-like [Uranotaenia lowii]
MEKKRLGVQTKFSGLFQRPGEPLFVTKSSGKVYYDLPENTLRERYRPIGQALAERFGADAPIRVPVKDVGKPDISFALEIPRRGPFTLFGKAHREIAGKLVEMFMDQPDVDDMLGLAAYCRSRLNPDLFQYALSVAVQHRKDTRKVAIPSALQTFPEKFADPVVMTKLMEEGRAVDPGNRMAVEIPMNYTASNSEPEQAVAYFREDIGLNLHHWHWHLVYPAFGPISVVNKDRRGELFYYMHTQMMGHYNLHRFSNGLARVEPLSNLRSLITPAYYPKMIQSFTGRSIPSRYPNMALSDVSRDGLMVRISDVENDIKAVTSAIDAGSITNTVGTRINLDNKKGIDYVGNMVESSTITPNPDYGDFHNLGHVLLAAIHDPRATYLESFGIMGDTTTACRDPIFFRWHTFVDDVFRRHKNRLVPYTASELSYSNIQVAKVVAKVQSSPTSQSAADNTLLTFWQRSQVDLGTGLDFGPSGNVFATFTHLQNAPFVFQIQVLNGESSPRLGTVRIYLLPTVNEKGIALSFEDQRRFSLELDTFKVSLNPGVNNITRKSLDSSVTIPYERSFRNISQSNQSGRDDFRFCNCGWPAHLLIPKGSTSGIGYTLCVMVSDYTKDVVIDFDETQGCNDSHSFCGLRGKKYPDAQAMGYPFDRKFGTDVQSVADLVNKYSNIASTPVVIRFTNTVISRT